MKTNQIYTAYVSWNNGGKRRPVLIINDNGESVRIYSITTKYESKSKEIRKYYYKISGWQDVGLKKQSYVDTLNQIDLLKADIRFEYVGRLSIDDRIGLAEFIENNKRH